MIALHGRKADTMKKTKRKMSLNAQMDRARLAKDFKHARRLARRILKLRLMTCSETWYEQVCASGESYPPIGMVLCRAEVRLGLSTAKGRRWTPKACADWEDAADLFGRVKYPSSVGSFVRMSDLRRGYLMELPAE